MPPAPTPSPARSWPTRLSPARQWPMRPCWRVPPTRHDAIFRAAVVNVSFPRAATARHTAVLRAAADCPRDRLCPRARRVHDWPRSGRRASRRVDASSDGGAVATAAAAVPFVAGGERRRRRRSGAAGPASSTRSRPSPQGCPPLPQPTAATTTRPVRSAPRRCAAWRRRSALPSLSSGLTARRSEGGATGALPSLSSARRGDDALPSLSSARAARRRQRRDSAPSFV